jgi:hypothetical protein
MHPLSRLLLIGAVSATGHILHASSTGSLRVELYDAVTLATMPASTGAFVTDYDNQPTLEIARVSTSWIWNDASCNITLPGSGYIVTSYATDYIPYTQSNIQVYNASTTVTKHYLYRPVLHLAISPSSVTEGGTATGTVTLKNSGGTNVTIMNAVTVNLSSNSVSRATVPSSVTIAANTASNTFTITAVDNAVVDGSASVTITATAGTWGNVGTAVTVLDND